MPLLVGISGLCGCGKSTAVEFLASKMPARIVYLGGMILEKLAKEGLERTPENELKVQNEIREQHGAAALAVLAAPMISDCFSKNEHVIIDAIFSPDEYDYFLANCSEAIGTTLAIHSSLHVRCERLSERPERRMNREQVIVRDRNEVLHLGASRAITLAGHHIANNGPLEAFHRDLEEFLKIVSG